MGRLSTERIQDLLERWKFHRPSPVCAPAEVVATHKDMTAALQELLEWRAAERSYEDEQKEAIEWKKASQLH